jgi:ornithine carbamoyltransferase
MEKRLKNRHFLKLLDFQPEEIHYLLGLSLELKKAKKQGTEVKRLMGKNIALIFEKTSTRTRCAFEVAAYDQGANITYLSPDGSQIGHKESIKDTARVLGRMYDGIQYRGFGQHLIEELAQYAGVPVWNGLTDEFHPTQILADYLTIMENFNKPLEQVKFCYMGDARFNMGKSYMVGAAKMGMDFRIAAPLACQPGQDIIDDCRKIAAETGAKITLTENIEEAVKDVDVIATDVWVSMGEADAVWEKRIEMLLPYQVNKKVMDMTGNPNTIFLHCLPAYHNRETKIGEMIYQKFGIDAMEVTEDVFESPASKVFDEAENRLHTIKAVMVATIGN